jgi:hypothetical protein
MFSRHTLSLAFFVLVGCGQSHAPAEDSGVPTSDTGDGMCCPIADFSGCSPGATPLPAGGWAGSAAGCVGTISGFDGRPFARQIDAHGCPFLTEVEGCCGCVPPDAGVDSGFVADAGAACAGLGPAACLAAGCAPDFDDLCCPLCTPGACADCTNLAYESCQPYASACLGGPSCGQTPAWGCGPVAPLCDDAHVVDEDSCDRVGCVPGYPSGSGDPDPSTAHCVPIVAESCTVMCRSLPPPCPTGTTAEGDGSCYTGLCVPAFVCE